MRGKNFENVNTIQDSISVTKDRDARSILNRPDLNCCRNVKERRNLCFRVYTRHMLGNACQLNESTDPYPTLSLRRGQAGQEVLSRGVKNGMSMQAHPQKRGKKSKKNPRNRPQSCQLLDAFSLLGSLLKAVLGASSLEPLGMTRSMYLSCFKSSATSVRVSTPWMPRPTQGCC